MLFWGTIFWHSMTDNYFMIRYQVKNNIMHLFYYLIKAWVIENEIAFPLNHQDFCKNHLHSFNECKSGRENLDSTTTWKVSKYGVISGPHFTVFSPDTGKYGPQITPYLGTFRAVDMQWFQPKIQIEFQFSYLVVTRSHWGY